MWGAKRRWIWGEGLRASLDLSWAGTAASTSWFHFWLLLLGVAAPWLCLGTPSLMGKGVRGLQLTCLVFNALSGVFAPLKNIRHMSYFLRQTHFCACPT